MKANITLTILGLLLLGGCAAGNTYDYRTALVGIPLQGTGNIDVQVEDQRPYIVNGDKPANFVGLQRGGYGNPFNVTTTSTAALADDLEVAISDILSKSGYTIVNQDTATKERTLELRLVEWKTDVMMRMKVLYDLVLTVYDADGTKLARNQIDGEQVAGGGTEHQNSSNAASTFEIKFSELLRNQDIQEAMNSTN